MKLNDPLITSFIYEDEEYNIDLSFDNVLDVFEVLADEILRDFEKAEIALELLLGEPMEKNVLGLWGYVYKEFIVMKTKQPIEYDLKGNPMPIHEDDEDVRLLDLDQDAEYIYASFMQAYHMDLYQQQGKLHWQEFKALLNGLPSDTIMQRIIQIRLWRPSKHEPTEYKENMRKLQKIYALGDNNME